MKKSLSSLVVTAGFLLSILTSAVLMGEESVSQKVSKSVNKAEVKAKTIVDDVMNRKDIVIDFDAKSSLLKENEKQNITALVKSLDLKPAQLKIAVAGWSDQSMPEGEGAKLSIDDENLAAGRIDAVVKYLGTVGKFSHIETFNMAKNSSMLSRIFATDEATLKKEMAGRNTNDKEMDYVASVLKDKGKASSVVMVIYNLGKLKTATK